MDNRVSQPGSVLDYSSRAAGGETGLFSRYMHWLHTRWPAGRVEKMPVVGADGSTNVPGLYIAGDLAGIPLLKFAADTGARVVQTILKNPTFQKSRSDESPLDLIIVGGGVAGMSAALEAKKAGLRFVIIESAEPFSTIVNFPKAKPIFTYPTDMKPIGELQVSADVKEKLVEELRSQTVERGIEVVTGRVEEVRRDGNELEARVSEGTGGTPVLRAHSVIIAVGQSGDFRKLDIPGENLDKVYNRLHDPKDFTGRDVLVVGGGDSAIETTVAIAAAGGRVTLIHRGSEFARPKPENIDSLRRSSATVLLDTEVKEIQPTQVLLQNTKRKTQDTIPNDIVFTMIGRQPPLDLLRRCGIKIRGDWRTSTWISFILFFGFCIFLYQWKGGGLYKTFKLHNWFPFNLPRLLAGPSTTSLLGTLIQQAGSPTSLYALAYSLLVTFFGIRRIRKRKTPYITAQTWTLIAIQVVPLFLLPYILLPWAGNNGWFDSGFGKTLADLMFPSASGLSADRPYWRTCGFILAWPLFVHNVFTDQPMWFWLIVSLIQTFIIIPLIIYRWGKGAYCGWICSCGALAETLGDEHRKKTPHGPIWNRLNMVGQVILALAFLLLILRIFSWIVPGTIITRLFAGLHQKWGLLSYSWFVDTFLAGIIGLGLYFHFSGRIWCRFACPLAALMHIYARFSRFRIFADKKKCISCNVCTSVCHQGIDVMNFANKGLAMEDPECVRCSACVQSCPTGVLEFGRLGPADEPILDRLAASPVRMVEMRVNGKEMVRQ